MRGTSRATGGTGIYSEVARGTDNGTSGGAIRDPTDVLKDGRVVIRGVDPSVKAGSAIFVPDL